MSGHRTGKWSTKKRSFLSFGILSAYAIGFLLLYFYMEDSKGKRVQEELVEEEKDAEQEVRELLSHFYMDEERSEMNEEVGLEIYDAFNEKLEQIQDEEVKYELAMEGAYAVLFMQAQNIVRTAFVDGELSGELTDEDIELLENAMVLAERELPNFAAKIAPAVKKISVEYAGRKKAK